MCAVLRGDGRRNRQYTTQSFTLQCCFTARVGNSVFTPFFFLFFFKLRSIDTHIHLYLYIYLYISICPVTLEVGIGVQSFFKRDNLDNYGINYLLTTNMTVCRWGNVVEICRSIDGWFLPPRNVCYRSRDTESPRWKMFACRCDTSGLYASTEYYVKELGMKKFTLFVFTLFPYR